MKKFSNITNQKVGVENTDQNKLTETDIFKYKVSCLMDDLLKVEMYGPVTRYSVAGTMKVAGKEMFVDALLDMLNEFSTNDKIKMLEGLKSKSKDWELIDESIDEMNLVLEKISDGKLIKYREFIKSFYKRYKNDKQLLIKELEKNINKLKNPITAYWRGIAAESMASEKEYPNNLMKEISQMYHFKAKQLGFTK
jgi:hypothetical protein